MEYDSNSPRYNLISIILDIANTRLYKPTRSVENEVRPRAFFKLPFANKGIDAINISNILNNKSVQSKIPSYFQNTETPVISYKYSIPIASKIFNYKKVLRDLQLDDVIHDKLTCSCSSSPFKYNETGHVITGNLDIVNNEKLKKLLSKGPKFREPPAFTWRQNFKIIMDSVEEYARGWAKREEEDLDSLSEWIKQIRSLVRSRIFKLQGSMNTSPKTILNDPDIKTYLSHLHEKYVVVPADKASNNIVFVCKKYYINSLAKELGVTSSKGNATYALETLTKEEVLDNHKSVLHSYGLTDIKDNLELPLLYWIPKLHKNPYKERYIAGSAKCSTKPLSKLLTSILQTIKEGLQSYCETSYSRSGVNQMWILKNSKDLLDYLKSQSLSQIYQIKTFDFSTLYTTIPHDKLKERLKDLLHNAFYKKNGNRRYKYIAITKQRVYFVKNHTDTKNITLKKRFITCWHFL